MIINCPCGEKKFEIDQNLIPDTGRLVQCGFCDEKWFFNKNEKEILKPKIDDKKEEIVNFNNDNDKLEVIETILENKVGKKEKRKTNFSFTIFLSYILVSIISFIALIILIDTFKTPLYRIFPNLELILFNLFETLKDIKLFIIDLF